MHPLNRLIPILALLLALLGLPAGPAEAHNVSELGYRWALIFDFEQNFNGRLSIEVGPVEDGALTRVDESSTTVVRCARVGVVGLAGGRAVFNGGHLSCELDLAGALLANHGIALPAAESYPGMTMRARLTPAAYGPAPLLVHPDMAYGIEFSTNRDVRLFQKFATAGGIATSQAIFGGLSAIPERTYGYTYGCDPAGPCAAEFFAGAAAPIAMPVAGGPVSFTTGPTTFLIGGDGATTFQGGISDLIVDPGNGFPHAGS